MGHNFFREFVWKLTLRLWWFRELAIQIAEQFEALGSAIGLVCSVVSGFAPVDYSFGLICKYCNYQLDVGTAYASRSSLLFLMHCFMKLLGYLNPFQLRCFLFLFSACWRS
jgi:hypothetical protein